MCGSGPAGSLAAVYLARAGYSVDVCEARALPDPLGRNLDRSYHLAMSHRGMSAVEQARDTDCCSGWSQSPREGFGAPLGTRPLPGRKATHVVTCLRLLSLALWGQRSALRRHVLPCLSDCPGYPCDA